MDIALNPYIDGPEENTISDRLRQLKQRAIEKKEAIKKEVADRREAQGVGRMGFKDGLAAVDIDNAEARQERWGKNPVEMNKIMVDLKKKARENKDQGVLGKVKEEGMSSLSMATSNLLEKSWLNIFDSYGLTLIYINFHVFCRFVFGPEMFCKLGQEWVNSVGGKEMSAASKVSGSVEGAAKSEATGFLGIPLKSCGFIEGGILVIVDALIAIGLMIQLIPFFIGVMIVTDPVGSFFKFSAVFWAFIRTSFGL